MYLSRGQRVKLSDLCKSTKFIVKILTENDKNTSYDISCFGLDETDKCSDENYLIFYNQKISPCKSIILLDSYQNNSTNFEIDLSKLPNKIKKLVFTVTVDGNETMAQLKQGSLLLFENNNLLGGFKFQGSDFQLEKSIIVSEIYLKDLWRFSAVGIGFNGGLSSLLEYFGIEEEKNDSDNKKPDNSNNEPDPRPDPEPPKKNKLTGFFKNILSAPFKNIEKKKIEAKEQDEKRAKELNEHNEKLHKESKFKELLVDYLSDGELTNDEMKGLETFCKDNNLNLQECLSKSYWEIDNFLHLMLANIVSDGVVTDEEEATINSVCRFLNPSSNIKNEIENTFNRVKLIEKVKKGDIPSLTNHSIITKISEIVWHYQPKVKSIRQLKKETKYDEGEIFVTSERIIFKSKDYPSEILLKNILDFEVDGANFYVVGKTNKSTSHFRSNESEILEAYVDQAINKFHRKLNLSQTAKKTRAIPQDVKQEVWIRDCGQCVECQATEYLEYDHVIPFSKGGSNSTNNIQLLCRRCNLNKRDNI
jgi:stress response protein SCP2